MSEDIKVWILTAAVSVLIWIVATSAKQGLRRLEEMVHDVKNLGLAINRQEERIAHLQESNNTASQRMNDHAGRIRELEQKIAVLNSKVQN